MISKLSSHLGPASIFSGGESAPSLILYLDAGNPLSYSPSGFMVSGGGTQHILNNWPSQPSEWNNYGPNYLQGGDFQDFGTPLSGWYIVDDNGHTFQVLSNSVWFTGGSPTPYYNGQGWFFVLDGTFSISASNSTVTFYETLPTVTPIYGSTTWYDLTNLNNDISLTNTNFIGTYSQLSKFEGAFEFGGTNSFGSLISGTAIPLMDSHYTIEAWFQSNSYISENGGIIGWGNYGNSLEVNALRQNNDQFVNYWWASDLTSLSASYSTDYWYYIASTYDGVNRKIYLNGDLLATDVPGVSHSVPSFNNLKVGVTAEYLDEYFNGKIGTIKVWNKNLNSSQVLASFNSSKSKYGYDYGSMTFSSVNSSYVASSDIYYEISTNDFTLEAFVKTATQSGYDGIVSLRSNSTQIGPRINISNTGCFEFWGDSSGYNTYTASNDKWYHVAMSRNSGTVSCFVNGKLENQFYDNADFNSSDIVVGRYYTNHNDHYIDGYISNVRLVNGTGLYTSEFAVPTTPLSSTVSNTKFLILSQEINPVADIIGHSTTNNNVGWTSSLPVNVGSEFNFTNFSSTDGLELVNINSITSNMIYMTIVASSSTPANVYYDQLLQFDKNFSFEWVFECSGSPTSPGADGFCVQWTTSKALGDQGGNVGKVADSSTINAFLFQTYFNNQIYWYHNNSSQMSQSVSPFNMRQNVYYWMDYDYNNSIMYISYATTNTKPAPQHTFYGVTFDSGLYYIGVGAATGGSTDNHILKSMKLVF